MKKFTAFILAMVMTFTLVGCGKSEPKLTHNSVEDHANFEEILLFDNEYCSCTVTNVYPSPNGDMDIYVRCQNKMPDAGLEFDTDIETKNDGVNGVSIVPDFCIFVKQGETQNGVIRFSAASLKNHNIAVDDIYTITFDIMVISWSKWSDVPYARGEFTLEF